MSQMRNPLERARGHGSAKSGVHHWLAQRTTALLLLALIPWALYALVVLAGSNHAEAAGFVARPLNASLLILLLASLLYHAVLGLQVVIEDYVHCRGLEILLHFLVRLAALIAGITGTLHILQLALGI